MSNFSRLVSRILVPVLAFFGPSSSFARAAVQNRIDAAVTDTERASVQHTIPLRARRATDLGEAPADRVLSSVSVHFNMTAAQQADLTQLLIDQQNPSSPLYHQWLTPQQYGARFGMSSADLATVKAWLSGRGLTITAVAPSLNYVTVSGTIGQVERAFGTSIHSMTENGVQHFANVTDPTLPAAIARVVSGITGLNDFKLQSRAAVRPQFTSSISGSHYIAPGDFFTIYNGNPLIQNSVTGTGITIAIAGQTDISLTDVAAFRSASGLPASTPTIVTIPGYVAGTVTGDVDEAQLDVEWSGAVAPGATIVFVTAGASQSVSVMDALIYSITNKVAPIISISYGACEVAWGQSNLNVLNQYFQQANAQGSTVIGPSGDSGATDCDYQLPTATQGLAVDFPASSPFVTAAGGTMFNEGSGTYWGGTNGSYSGSALGYIPETVWNESNSTGLGAGGGGVSSYFSKPAWQVGNGVPTDQSRDVPDISLNAASAHDGYLFCSRGSCTNGYRNASSNLNVVGGTSVGSPAFAGILALLEQKLGATTGLGNVNPTIYGLANSTYYGNVFHDVTSGNNNSTCVVGTQDCPTGGSIGYSAGPGYDRATGWGSLDVANFVNYWSQVTPAGTGATIGTTITSTTVSSSSATCGVSSGSVPLTIKVTGVSGGIASGSVQILVDNVALADPASNVALDGTGTATYNLNTTALTSGGHTVSAIYSGNAALAGSKGALVIDVVSSAQKDFALTPCQAGASARSGSTASGVTFTLTPFNGFTGTINVTATAQTPVASQFTFSVNPVNITSSSAVTTTFTIAAYQNSAKTSSSQDVVARHGSSRHMPWYEAGSGATLACALLLTLPRRRRWGALLAVVLSAGVFTAAGCGGGSSSSSPSNTTTPTVTNAAAGTYDITITAVAGGVVHSTNVTFQVTAQ
ncbi:protease pro-enzyme activation domain-containing protein [Edaphobacter aggregans]|uniref:protease pro-enzyme activation domain-containing protein n=1 Tax=Edaphobacter aggregans TaxID=570835 RepID=UPI00054E079D|nr:protease pro-enzyme activation domain-containing protein [Edaphobacter aggregans]